jgi:molybdopterin-guanine dinucleotide biosynthesis protein A
MRLDRDLAQLMLMRNEAGGRRIMPGLAEAFLKERYAAASDTMSKLDKNQAELDYIQALDRMRGDKDAFLNMNTQDDYALASQRLRGRSA